jgi:hypothetical protein
MQFCCRCALQPAPVPPQPSPHLCDAASACAQLPYPPPPPSTQWVFRMYALQLPATFRLFSLPTLMQVLWGAATATASLRAADDDDSASAQAVTALWGDKGRAMIDAVALRAVQISESMRGQEVSNVLWACAVLRCRRERHYCCHSHLTFQNQRSSASGRVRFM